MWFTSLTLDRGPAKGEPGPDGPAVTHVAWRPPAGPGPGFAVPSVAPRGDVRGGLVPEGTYVIRGGNTVTKLNQHKVAEFKAGPKKSGTRAM